MTIELKNGWRLLMWAEICDLFDPKLSERVIQRAASEFELRFSAQSCELWGIRLLEKQKPKSSKRAVERKKKHL